MEDFFFHYKMMVRPWKRLPRQAVNAPSLVTFKIRSVDALSKVKDVSGHDREVGLDHL